MSVYQQRRMALMQQLPQGSVALISAATEQTRSNDTEYLFRQDSDFYYLTGFNEPDAQLLLRPGQTPASIIFVRPTNKEAEIWHGRRLGVDCAAAKLKIDQAYSVTELDEQLLALTSGASAIAYLSGHCAATDSCISQLLSKLRQGGRQGLKPILQQIDIRPTLHEMRLIKSAHEVELMAQAGQISARAHTRAMVECRPGVMEYQLEATIQHECAMAGARSMAYGTIVGGGDNACILHYTENESELQTGDLVLIDAGAEYQGYAADITRTFPVSGRFSPAQAALYQIVLDSQKAAIEQLKPGASIKQAGNIALEILVSGLVDLGILKGEVSELIEQEAYKPFYMHGLGHWIGMDVHDVGDYGGVDRSRTLVEGMALTVEPGLYIAPDADVDPQYQGIGIRIEDDIVITATGYRNLTADVVKEIAEIESLMQG